MQTTIIDISDSKNYDIKDWQYKDIVLFSDEWELRRQQCENFINSQNKIYDKKIYARQCNVKQIDKIIGKQFLDDHHIQGANNLSLVFFGLFFQDDLIGVMTLGRHNRQISSNRIVLDRFCIAFGIHVCGGATKLFSRCTEWAKQHRYDEIISFSDNRLTNGHVYEVMGFSLEKNHKPDYCYIDTKNPKHRISKQSQKKSAVKCPSNMTELQWAEVRGLKRLWDYGKKRWVFHLNPNALSWKNKLSIKCAQQNRDGVFKHSHLRGYFQSKKCNADIYYGSSYELRCLYLLENDQLIKNFKRCDIFLDSDGATRNPDLLIEDTKGKISIYEVKPERRLTESEVQKQIQETLIYAQKNNYEFLIWSEKDSGLATEHAIIKWAKQYIAETSGDYSLIERQKSNNRLRSKKHYDNVISKRNVTVYCEYCKKNHNVLQRSYDNNIARNGRYLCESEGGSISGKKFKKKKENLYSVEGKKQCNYCQEIKLFEEFGIDKTKSDGYATRCKTCRAKVASERYNQSKK